MEVPCAILARISDADTLWEAIEGISAIGGQVSNRALRPASRSTREAWGRRGISGKAERA